MRQVVLAEHGTVFEPLVRTVELQRLRDKDLKGVRQKIMQKPER